MSGKINREEFKAKLNHLVSSMRKKIIEGDINVGDYLPSELILAEQYGLSKNSVRKGLEELVSEGLIVKKSRIGNQVASTRPFDQVILRVGYYPSLIKDAQLKELIKRFEAENPAIKVQTIALPYEHYRHTVQDFFQNDMIDVVTINYKDFCDFNHYQSSVFEEIAEDPNIYSFLQKPFSAAGKKKTQYVKPFVFSPIVLCYNKEHFDQKGMAYPDSGWKWDDALEAASQLMKENQEDGRCGLYFHPLSLNRWPILLLQNRVEFTRNSNGEPVFPGKEFLESVNLLRALFDEQQIMHTFLSDSDRDAEKLFLEQKASMIMASYFSLNEIKNHKIQYDIAPLPYLKDPSTLLLIIGLAINKFSSKKEAAAKFVDYLSGEDAQEIIRTNTLSIPAMKKAAERQDETEVYKPLRYQLFREIIPTYKLYTDIGLTAKEFGEVRNELRIYLSDLMDDKIFQQRLQAKLTIQSSIPK
ncbi:extracellular solute-binding protein [Falsibacillus pallidus]|uniref:Multiple sugar transport system substrate-binding protein n=1 Tax=Falsibacillus pallidus TaxID=493781 RepID=A0A370GC21_9BACI|nr:extracellular solute-binding protein [Falsibacillus pallidus]RDI40004.1 multiple sugar transport system substrate-binding protein [Falsibacillus pallidus]